MRYSDSNIRISGQESSTLFDVHEIGMKEESDLKCIAISFLLHALPWSWKRLGSFEVFLVMQPRGAQVGPTRSANLVLDFPCVARHTLGVRC